MSADGFARRRGLARVALGLSILLAVAGFAYFALRGRPLAGAGLGTLFLISGIWEYRRRIQGLRTANRYEPEENGTERRE